MSFESSIAAYLSNPAMKAKLKKYASGVYSAGRGGVVNVSSEAAEYAQKAHDAIVASLPDSLTKGSTRNITGDDLIISGATINKDGDFEIRMHWNPKAIRRDSLYLDSSKYDGVDDIVALFSHGYHAKAYAYGYWKRPGFWGNIGFLPARSMKDRDADPSIINAVARFNSEHEQEHVHLYIDDANYIPE
jgi:hypothetical protein